MTNDLDKINRKQRAEQLLDATLGDFQTKGELEDHNLNEMSMTIDEAFDSYKKAFKESQKIITPNVKPIGQNIITTAVLLNAMEQKKQLMGIEFNLNLIANLKRSISDVQTVVAVGPACKEVKVGDLVKIRFQDFERIQNPNTVNAKETFDLPLEVINDRNYVEMHERNLKYIIN